MSDIVEECIVCEGEGIVEHHCSPDAIVHRALKGYLEDGELAVTWCLTIDVAGPDGRRYIAHRSGGGHDGTDGPEVWTALGMLRAAVSVAEAQLLDMTVDAEDEDDDD